MHIFVQNLYNQCVNKLKNRHELAIWKIEAGQESTQSNMESDKISHRKQKLVLVHIVHHDS